MIHRLGANMVPTFERVRLESPGLQAAHEDRPSLDDCNYIPHELGEAANSRRTGRPTPLQPDDEGSRPVGPS